MLFGYADCNSKKHGPRARTQFRRKQPYINV